MPRKPSPKKSIFKKSDSKKAEDTPKKYVPPTPKPVRIPKAQTNWQCMYGCGQTFVTPKGASGHEGGCSKNPANK